MAQLTPLQARRIYFCERDQETGNPIITEVHNFSDNPKDWFVRRWQRIGLRDDLIEKLWGEILLKEQQANG